MRSNEYYASSSQKILYAHCVGADQATEVGCLRQIQIWVLWGRPKGLPESRIRFSMQKCYFCDLDVDTISARSDSGRQPIILFVFFCLSNEILHLRCMHPN